MTYGHIENVRIVPVMLAELKFRDIQRHVFGAQPHADNELSIEGDGIKFLSFHRSRDACGE